MVRLDLRFATDDCEYYSHGVEWIEYNGRIAYVLTDAETAIKMLQSKTGTWQFVDDINGMDIEVIDNGNYELVATLIRPKESKLTLRLLHDNDS